MTLASEARVAVRRRPFLHAALAAGVVNYTAAARYLALGDDAADEETVATALRRYADDLEPPAPNEGQVRVTMRRSLGRTDDEPLLRVGDAGFGAGAGDHTGIVVEGAVAAATLGRVLARLDVEGIDPVAAAGREGHLVLVVPGTDGVDALRYVEDALE
jgi:hypothetical protein